MPLHPSTGFRWLNRWLALKMLGKEGKKPNDYLVGVAGFEPATPASRTQGISSKLLIFLVVTGAFVSFCSRSFHPIRCDFIAAFSERTRAYLVLTVSCPNAPGSFDQLGRPAVLSRFKSRMRNAFGQCGGGRSA